MCLSECIRPTCTSSLGTSSYVLESVEVLLEDVAHLGSEKKGKLNLLEVWTSLRWSMALLWPRPNIPTAPSLSHSQEGMPCSVADVSNGFHVNVVVMQWLWICRGACLCQEDAKPPSKFLWAASLKRDRANQTWNLKNMIDKSVFIYSLATDGQLKKTQWCIITLIGHGPILALIWSWVSVQPVKYSLSF